MKTRTMTMFGAGALLALAVCGAAFLTRPGEIEASAVAKPSLFLPGSYEEYLPLERPSDAAMSEEYVAVADGGTLYVYDRAEGVYSSYLHEVNGTERPISALGFTEDGTLFFSDRDTQLYRYDIAEERAVLQAGIPSSTFLIEGDTLYTTAVSNTVTTIFSVPIRGDTLPSDLRTVVGEVPSLANATPRLAVQNGILYCAFNHRVYSYAVTENGYESQSHYLAGPTTDVTNLAALCSHGDELYYAVDGTLDRDGLYRTVLDQGSELLYAGSGIASLFSYDGTLYAVQNGSVRAFSPEDGATLTGYEIGGGSDAPNRISDAGETVRSGDLLVIADEGNRRVLVYDVAEESYCSVSVGGVPSCVATDGESFGVSVGNHIYLYEKGADAPYYTHTAESTVSGLTCVYGTYYYVTEHSYYGIAREGEREVMRSGTAMPVAAASDLKGNIYVADASGRIDRFTEKQFTDPLSSGRQVNNGWSLPSSFRSLRADHTGDLYYLSGSSVYRNGVRLETFDASSVLYLGGESPAPVSFALSFSDSTLYLNYGDFMLTAEVSFPNLGSIPAQGLYEELRTVSPSEDLVYTHVLDGAVGIRIDLDALGTESTVLPYRSHGRLTDGGTALVLGETDNFILLALYADHGYSVLLVPEEDCLGLTVTKEPVAGTRYLSSDVAATSYPLFSDALTLETLPRGSQVTLVSTVTPAEGYGFAEVRYGEDGHGYVPLDYLTNAAPVPPENDEYRLGYLKASDGITFYAADDRSNTVRVTERILVKIYEAENGALDVCFEDETGTLYTAQVTSDMLEAGGEDALRMSVIIILCVIAVGICAVYVLLVPKKPKN